MNCCKQNVGSLDRAIRVIVGLILFCLAAYVFGDTWQIAAYILGVIAIITGLTGFCGFYALTGINTLGDKK